MILKIKGCYLYFSIFTQISDKKIFLYIYKYFYINVLKYSLSLEINI